MEKHPEELKKTFQFLRYGKLFWFQAAHLEKKKNNKQTTTTYTLDHFTGN